MRDALIARQSQIHVPKIIKEIPYNHENKVTGPYRIECSRVCWWFKDLCLHPPVGNKPMHIVNVKNHKHDINVKWMMHEDPSGKFFRLENFGSKKFLTTRTKQIDYKNLGEPWRDNHTPLELQAYDNTNSFDQLWTFGSCEKNEVILRHYKDGRVIDVNWWKLQED